MLHMQFLCLDRLPFVSFRLTSLSGFSCRSLPTDRRHSPASKQNEKSGRPASHLDDSSHPATPTTRIAMVNGWPNLQRLNGRLRVSWRRALSSTCPPMSGPAPAPPLARVLHWLRPEPELVWVRPQERSQPEQKLQE